MPSPWLESQRGSSDCGHHPILKQLTALRTWKAVTIFTCPSTHQTKDDLAEFQWILAHYDAVLETG